jgi:hypothetical protein
MELRRSARDEKQEEEKRKTSHNAIVDANDPFAGANEVDVAGTRALDSIGVRSAVAHLAQWHLACTRTGDDATRLLSDDVLGDAGRLQ